MKKLTLNFVEGLALSTGQFLLKNLSKLKRGQIHFKGKNDYVTDIDRGSEKKIVAAIRRHFPDHAIMAEESYAKAKRNFHKPLWIIDPLDGTTNFIHGLPVFAVSIGVWIEGKIILGVVFDPNRNELFSAERGKGAFLNHQRIHVSQTKKLKETLLATGFPFRSEEVLDDYLKIFKALCPQVSGIRRGGSAALDLAYVACGRFDGFWELGLQPWDIAAGWLLIEEAGGKVSNFKKGPFQLQSQNVMAGNPNLYPYFSRNIQVS
ncbi:MAG: inositol monophosphatase [Chlamydiae bacterium]|nr:inositol monophosphatase [Chlamydiota bacterium]MBI3277161.1 inositol monophosphatase [Chlamydiota bacterium]